MRVVGKLIKRARVRSVTLLISIMLLILVAVGGTVAYLLAETDPIENTFVPSKVTTSVDETFEDGVKTDVSIKNTGDTEAYIRAAVVVTWQDENGNVFGQPPIVGTDYEIEYDLENGWVLSEDGFYYWKLPVKSVEEDADNCNTGVLITECKMIGTAPDGYSLSVEIIGSGIQSVPTKVVTEMWSSGVSGVNDDATLEIITGGEG